jgi:uncharacterized membrane protein YphA (DoxX/SURF4 family)
MTFLQNFTGVLFIVSGFVKAIDPMGTAFKMEQYFTEFEYTLADTAFSFLAPLFPALSSISVLFSVVMIIFEIILGVMLLMGHKSKLTSWLFLLLVGFFTMLTGFTFLTGYVPSGVNFFQFGQWGPFTETNMRVTDCGCFGDFIKIVPRTSFLKDIFLLIPAFFFVFRHKDMHQLGTLKTRRYVLAGLTLGLLLFCLNNFKWGEPIVDFRPFAVGTNLYEKKMAEDEAMSSVKILAWKLQHNETREVVEIPYDEYMANYTKYPKETWTVIEQVKSKPAIEPTKLSEFSILAADGTDLAEDILTDPGHVFLVVAYKLRGDMEVQEVTVIDTTWRIDTVVWTLKDTTFEREIATLDKRQVQAEVFTWDDDYIRKYLNKVNPLIQDVKKQGARVYGAAGGAGSEKLKSFRQATGTPFAWHEADDILLKTIMRSNPGVLHLKGGVVIHKWHINDLPKTIELE